MIKNIGRSLGRNIGNLKKVKLSNVKQQWFLNQNVFESKNNILGSIRIQYSFARKLFNTPKSAQKLQSIPAQKIEIQKTQKVIKPIQPDIYTFSDLDSDLQKYQSFLNIFNTHTKKPHQKLLTNQLKIIQAIIAKKRDDLLEKFLSVNYRNRLANPQTTKIISKHFQSQIEKNIEKIVNQPQYCQLTLERVTLLTQYNEPQIFDNFALSISKKLNLPVDSDNYLKILQSLPSKKSQLLFMYNLLIQLKDLPLSIMQSKFFGLNTDNLNFHKLGEVFYEFRKFMRRYFAIFSKKVEVDQSEINENSFKSFQRQSQKSSQASLIQQNVFCFLKTMGYKSVRKQILIDGFAVDFVVDKITKSNPKKNISHGSKPQNQQSYILQVMGSYHYTSAGRLKGRDLRKLILLGSKYRTKQYHVKILHFDDYNKSKGHRNKMELIRHLLESTDNKINWQPRNQGYDSKWQLKQTYEQFK